MKLGKNLKNSGKMYKLLGPTTDVLVRLSGNRGGSLHL